MSLGFIKRTLRWSLAHPWAVFWLGTIPSYLAAFLFASLHSTGYPSLVAHVILPAILIGLAASFIRGVWVSWRRSKVGAILKVGIPVAVLLSMAAVVDPPQKKARLAADNGTIAALRAASAIYYGKNDGTFPTQGTLQTLVPGFQLMCPGASWSADGTNGKITYSPNDIGAC